MSDESEALQHLRDMKRALNELSTILKKLDVERDIASFRDDRQLEKLAYGVPEAAQFCRLSKDYVWKLIHSGKLRSVKAGKRRLIPAVALKELLENR